MKDVAHSVRNLLSWQTSVMKQVGRNTKAPEYVKRVRMKRRRQDDRKRRIKPDTLKIYLENEANEANEFFRQIQKHRHTKT